MIYLNGSEKCERTIVHNSPHITEEKKIYGIENRICENSGVTVSEHITYNDAHTHTHATMEGKHAYYTYAYIIVNMKDQLNKNAHVHVRVHCVFHSK